MTCIIECSAQQERACNRRCGNTLWRRLSEMNEKMVLARTDGSTSSNPIPDLFDEKSIIGVGRVVFLESYLKGDRAREVFHSLAQAIEKAPWMNDDELEAVRAYFAGEFTLVTSDSPSSWRRPRSWSPMVQQ